MGAASVVIYDGFGPWDQVVFAYSNALGSLQQVFVILGDGPFFQVRRENNLQDSAIMVTAGANQVISS